MINLIKAEQYKLLHSRCFWGMTFGSSLLSSILLLDSRQLTANLFYAALYNTPILYFLTIVFAAVFVGEDFGNRTINSLICAGHSRSTVFFIKGIIYEIGSILILSVSLLVYGIYEMITGALPPIQFLQDCIMAFFSIIAMCSLPLLCSFVFKDIGRTLAVPMVLFFVSIFILNNDQAGTIATILPMGQLRLISLQALSVSNFTMIIIDILWVAILSVLTYAAFRRTDLK
ncbi:MAG: ABC transporter permease [Hespellia sp.]|nr:ABC transporter permease [Hespellia sp.]